MFFPLKGGGGLYSTWWTECACFEGDWTGLVLAGQECSSVSRVGAVYFRFVLWPSWELEAATKRTAPSLSTHKIFCTYLLSHLTSLYMSSDTFFLSRFICTVLQLDDSWPMHASQTFIHASDRQCVCIYTYISNWHSSPVCVTSKSECLLETFLPKMICPTSN